MNAKDYVKIAAAIKNYPVNSTSIHHRDTFETFIRRTLMPVLLEDNPRFNKNTFLHACGFKVDNN